MARIDNPPGHHQVIYWTRIVQSPHLEWSQKGTLQCILDGVFLHHFNLDLTLAAWIHLSTKGQGGFKFTAASRCPMLWLFRSVLAFTPI